MAEPLDIDIPWPGWRAVRRIGRGGFGAVYEIERDIAGVPERCAMKVVGVPPEEASEGSFGMGYDEESLASAYRERAEALLREYQIMAGLAHPNVVSCRDVSMARRQDGPGYDVFIRMELLTPLPKWLKGRGAHPSDAARVGRDVARALDACESRDIVHRDVKPDNIMADGWGTFKLGDFGVARSLEGTRTATMAGTATYMAPEVAGGHYGRTVDIYSLGLVMWWMLGGYRLPFMPEGRLSAGDAARAEAKRLAGEPIPAPQGCPPALSRIVLRACAYKPEDRYQSASEMAADLDAFLAGRAAAEPQGAHADVLGRTVAVHTEETAIRQDATDAGIPAGGPMAPVPPAPMPAADAGAGESDWGDARDATVGPGFAGAPAGPARSGEAVPGTVVRPRAGNGGAQDGPSRSQGEAQAAGESKPVPPAGWRSAGAAAEPAKQPGESSAAVSGHASGPSGSYRPPAPSSPQGQSGNSGQQPGKGITRRAFIIGGAAAAAAVVGAALFGQGASSTGSSSTGSSVATSKTVSASSSGIITLPTMNGNTSWTACDYSSVTSSPATKIIAPDYGVCVLRCEDGSTVVITNGDADQDMLEEVAKWTNLRKVQFGDYRASGSSSYKDYALGQRDDGSFVTTWDELKDAIASDTSGFWEGARDFDVTWIGPVDVITSTGKWLRREDPLDEDSMNMTPKYPDARSSDLAWSSSPAQSFPRNAAYSDVILLQDGTCWSKSGWSDVRSWSNIVQSVDTGYVYAAIDSDGGVHATTDQADEDEKQCCTELASWAGITRMDCTYPGVSEFVGVTSGGNVLLGDKTIENGSYKFKTYDLGLTGIVDAAWIEDWVIVVDGDGHVAAAEIYYLEDK